MDPPCDPSPDNTPTRKPSLLPSNGGFPTEPRDLVQPCLTGKEKETPTSTANTTSTEKETSSSTLKSCREKESSYRTPGAAEYNPAAILDKTDICLICGDKGILKDLIRCIQCKACAQHSYCLEETLHRDDDGNITWRCEDCAPNSLKCESESERIRHERKRKGEIPVKPSGGQSSESIKKRQNKNVLIEEPESSDSTLNISSEKQAIENKKCVDSEAIRHTCVEFDQNIDVQNGAEIDVESIMETASHTHWSDDDIADSVS